MVVRARVFNYIERYLFKVRYIYEYRNVKSGNSGQVQSYSLENVPGKLLNIAISERLRRFIEKRSDCQSWRLFVFEEQSRIVGYSFIHAPVCVEWNDSLPTHPLTARLSSDYVEQEFRGKGIRGKILSDQFEYCRQEGLYLWSAIERTNASAIRATEKAGGVRVSTNYLVKVIGRNVLSICTKPFEVYVLVGKRRSRL